MRHTKTAAAVIALAALIVMLFSCRTSPSVPVREYQLVGEVLRLDVVHRVATIKHQAIKGWMEAMTMEYPVREKAEFAKLHVGDRITATVFVQDLDYWVGRIHRESEK
ncbi:MAG TPA: copper-binding protein [Candidatus Acidoferrales bacterium]|nr:copper-binding protein [Candidatus Acidoferrales bacterium]